MKTKTLIPLLCLAACGADPDAAASVPGSAFFSGVYFVPERAALSTYPVDEAAWTVAGGTATLAYNLPRLLVGSHIRVRFSGPLPAAGGPIQLRGDNGTATCTANPSPTVLLSCTEQFTGLAVDVAEVRTRVAGLDTATADARVAVTERFSSEPIGVFEAEDHLVGPAGGTECENEDECAAGFVCEPAVGIGSCATVTGTLTAGQACSLDSQCQAPLECENDPGPEFGTCQERGRNGGN